MKNLIITILIFASIQLFALNEQATKFIWNDANSTMFTSKNENDFSKAAGIYSKLIEQDIDNQYIYYNLGIAYLMAEQYQNALLSFRKSEEYSGTTTELESCIENAYSKSVKSDVLTLPWYRILLFPQFKISFQQRLLFAGIAYSLIWLGLILKIFKVKTVATRLIIVSIVVFSISATSIAASIITLRKNFVTIEIKSDETNNS
ncbi:MAG: tetratricopeptide repeat protein [Kiritimatiellae bacterium]|jgi:tetratricopeptide (TPR) repeat protein|nr:tetratricopeptide repeat protein [Kiritimatiellia bacterium]